jgi:hypothetical protein
MFSYTFRPHRATFRQHILIEPTALCVLMSIILTDTRHYSECRYSKYEEHPISTRYTRPGERHTKGHREAAILQPFVVFESFKVPTFHSGIRIIINI